MPLQKNDYDEIKKDAIKRLKDLISKTISYNFDQTLEEWLDFSSHEFFNYFHKADRRKIFFYLADDTESEHPLVNVDLYDKEYIVQTREERDEEGLGSDNFFLIAGINDADDMGFVTNDLSRGIAISFHEDVFGAENLDEELASLLKDLSLVEFFEILQWRPDPRITDE